MEPAYLDFNATTPMDPRVFEVMRPWFLRPSNAGSRTHTYGQQAKQAVDDAREHIAALLNSRADDIVFTSGATESNNLAILGLTALGESTGHKHIISTAIEHKAVLEPLDEMTRRGFDVELAPVTSGGYVEPGEIRRRLRKDTLLVSVMHANNETGVMQPLDEIAAIVSDHGALLHTDAAQTFGKEPSLRTVGASLISISGHKIFGPQGVGALCVRRSVGRKRPIAPIMFGGGQERGLRPGTIPVALAVGLGHAAMLASVEWEQRRAAVSAAREDFLSKLNDVEFQVNGDSRRTLPHVLNISFAGVDSEALMMAIKQSVSISNGSACTSSQYSPSHVLVAMGLDACRVSEAVRISWGHEVGDLHPDTFASVVRQLSGR